MSDYLYPEHTHFTLNYTSKKVIPQLNFSFTDFRLFKLYCVSWCFKFNLYHLKININVSVQLFKVGKKKKKKPQPTFVRKWVSVLFLKQQYSEAVIYEHDTPPPPPPLPCILSDLRNPNRKKNLD